jgi:hypothetical protein
MMLLAGKPRFTLMSNTSFALSYTSRNTKNFKRGIRLLIMEDNILDWLQKWYISQCDGEWEHDEGNKIQSSDNPGWIVEINVKDTDVEQFEIPWKLNERSAHDWFGYSIENGIYAAAGDPTKLTLLLSVFKGIISEGKALPSILKNSPVV